MELTLEQLETLLPDASILLGVEMLTRDFAIRRAGELLVDAGAVDRGYIDQMLEREQVVSTFVGEGVAMPHGTLTAKNDVRAEALCLIVLAEPIDWAGQPVSLVIGIAAHGRRYITLLSQLASTLLDDDRAAELRRASTPAAARRILAG